MSDNPPPYIPHPPGGPSAPGFPSAFSAPPSTYPGSPFQTYPQTYTSGGDQSYYQGSPGAYLTQPGYPGYQSPATSNPWDGPKMYGEPPKHTVYTVGQNHGGGSGGGGVEHSCLKMCSAALCCCCLWDMLTSHFC